MTAPTFDSSRDPGVVADLIFETAGRPVRTAAEFYGLYYLAEIENDPDAQLEFRFQRDRIRDGLYWYTVFALLSELSTGNGHYYITGDKVQQVREAAPPGKVGRPFGPHAGDLSTFAVRPDDEVRRLTDRFVEMFVAMAPLISNRGPDQVAVRGFLEEAERWLDAVSDPQQFVDDVERFFSETSSPPAGRRSEFERENITGWLPQYNGEAWTAIAEHAHRLGTGELPDTSWVDQTWAIEHNNDNFLDKIDVTPQERRDLADIRGSVFGDDVGPDLSEGATRWLLIRLLDAARESDMELVFTYATHFDTEANINYERKAEQYDITVFTSDPLGVTFSDKQIDLLVELRTVLRGSFSGDMENLVERVLGTSLDADRIAEFSRIVRAFEERLRDDAEAPAVTVSRPEPDWRTFRQIVALGRRMNLNSTIRDAMRTEEDTDPMTQRRADELRTVVGTISEAVGIQPGGSF